MKRILFFSLTVLGLLATTQAQVLPNLQLCNATEVSGSADGEVIGRGTFSLTLDVTCQPENASTAYPQGTLSLDLNLNDPHFQGTLEATIIEGCAHCRAQLAYRHPLGPLRGA